MAIIFNIGESLKQSAFNILQEPIKMLMENEKEKHGNNRGMMFEDICTKVWNGEQTKANLDFTKGGDIVINGIHYQAKFGCSKGAATFSNEKTLVNLGL